MDFLFATPKLMDFVSSLWHCVYVGTQVRTRLPISFLDKSIVCFVSRFMQKLGQVSG